MVNRPLPRRGGRTGAARAPGPIAAGVKPEYAALAIDRRLLPQILGKLYSFNLRENLRLILLDYAPKSPRPANATFNGAC